MPKHTVDLILDQIALNLDETQYHNFLKLMAFFSHERRLVRVKKSKQPEETHGAILAVSSLCLADLSKALTQRRSARM